MGLTYEIKPVDIKNPNNVKRVVRSVVEIVNYYIEDAEGICADFQDKKVNPKKIAGWFGFIQLGYPFYVAESMIDNHLEIVGFGLLFPHGDVEMDTFNRTAEMAIYINGDYRGNGIGSAIMERLVADVKGKGIDNILSSLSSKNTRGIAFHEKHGFKICGKLVRAGKWKSEDIDIIWMQRLIP